MSEVETREPQTDTGRGQSEFVYDDNYASGGTLASNDVTRGFLNLPIVRQAALLVSLAAVVSFGVLLVLWSQDPDYKLLYGNLDPAETSAIVRVLEERQIQFTVEPESGMVLVPDSDLHEARMAVAAGEALLTRSEGYMLLDQEQQLGTSQFMENARHRRAIEGELAKTIASLKNVNSARVLLAIPKRSVFVRDKREPSASIFVELTRGTSLDKNQVKAIMHLVANSVPEMEKTSVTVINQDGTLLSDFDDESIFGQSEKQLEYQEKIEEDARDKVHQILRPVIGDTRFTAQVSAEVDFTRMERTDENFTPQSAIRSEITSEEMRGEDVDGGVPGALTNQPPGNVAVPPDVDGQPTQGLRQHNRQATRNYELDRTISYTRGQTGRVQRLTVAVVLDDRQVRGVEGVMESKPWAPEELESLRQLVMDASGYDEERGDRVTLLNQSFAIVETPDAVPVGFWTEPWFRDLARQVMVGLLLIIMVFGVLKPVMKMLAGPSAEDRMKAMLAEQDLERLAEAELEDEPELMQDTVTLSGGQELLLPGPGEVYARQLDAIKGLVAENPGRVAEVVKRWVAVE